MNKFFCGRVLNVSHFSFSVLKEIFFGLRIYMQLGSCLFY